MELLQADYVQLIVFVAIWYAFNPFSSGQGQQVQQQQADAIAGKKDPAAAFAAFKTGIYFDTLRRTAPSPGVFGAVWFVLYGLLAGAHFVYWRDGPTGEAIYTAGLVIWLVNLLLNKLWTPLFFGAQSPRWALLVLLLVLGTAVAALIIAAIDAVYITVGLLVPYTLWLLVALWLNWRFIGAYEARLAALSRRATAARV